MILISRRTMRSVRQEGLAPAQDNRLRKTREMLVPPEQSRYIGAMAPTSNPDAAPNACA
jgi:hypothetical protein